MARKLVLPPDQASYGVTYGTETIRQQLDGGFGRYRQDIIGASSIVNCQWTLGPEEFKYLQTFYKILSKSVEPFKIELYLDQPELTEHNAHFIPGSWRLVSQSGLTWVVGCQLEVEPLDNDQEYDESFIDVFEIYGSSKEAKDAFKILERLVNIDLNCSDGVIPLPHHVGTPPTDPTDPPTSSEGFLTDYDGTYLTDESGNYLSGLVEDGGIVIASFIDESSGALHDENSDHLAGEFA